MSLTIALALLLGALWLWFYITGSKNVSLPPGPIGIPLFGVLPFINKPTHVKFQEYSKKYGKICGFYMGQMYVVILSDYEMIKEALVKQADNFSGRPRSFPWRVFPDDEGIISSDGYLFKQYKSFIISTIKDFGAVRKHFEIVVKENAERFIKFLKTVDGQSVNILEPLGLSIAQSYCQILLGKTFEYKDPQFKKLIELSYREQRAYNNGARIFLPWTRKIPFIKKYVGEDEIRYVKSEIYKLYGKIVEDNEKTYVEGSRDSFIHSWLTEDRRRKEIDPNNTIFSKRNLVHNIDVVLCAGYETTTTTLRWSFLYLLLHPHVQEKVLKELDEVIGSERYTTLDDVKNLPYVCATIHEVHRCASIVPLGVTHRNKSTTSLGGFQIPQNSVICVNSLGVHTDPSLFPDPYTFNPDRFIDSRGKFVKSEHVISFSLGKRQCPGEPMAQIEIFFYFTHVFQHFSIRKANENDCLETTKSDSLSTIPPDFNMRFIKRHC